MTLSPAPMPNNLSAEQALLGQLMYDNAVFERVPDRLRASHFYEPFHQRLYDAIETSIRTGKLAEPTLLMSDFADDVAFKDFGGLRYLADLVDRAPPAFSAPQYANEIYDQSIRRDLIRIGELIAADARDPSLPGLGHVEHAEGALFELAEAGEQSKGVVPFSEALSGALAMAEAAFRRDGELSGLSTALVDLDRKLGGLHPSDLLILAGRPSMGKTALATNIAFNVAKRFREGADEHGEVQTVEGGRVLFFSLEMSKEQLATRILSDMAGVSGDAIRKGEIDAAQMRRLMEAGDELDALPLHIDDTGGLHIAKLAARARRQKRKTGLDLIVIDYLQLIVTDNTKGAGRVQEVTAITGALKALAKELDVPVIALSQLSRQVESRDDKRPMLSDLRESGSIEQDADCVMFVYREEYYLARSEPKPGTEKHMTWIEQMSQCHGKAEVIIGKQRHGPIGTVTLSFDADTTRFGNCAREGDYEHARTPYGDA